MLLISTGRIRQPLVGSLVRTVRRATLQPAASSHSRTRGGPPAAPCVERQQQQQQQQVAGWLQVGFLISGTAELNGRRSKDTGEMLALLLRTVRGRTGEAA